MGLRLPDLHISQEIFLPLRLSVSESRAEVVPGIFLVPITMFVSLSDPVRRKNKEFVCYEKTCLMVWHGFVYSHFYTRV